MVIGITGGAGSGKSHVLELFQEHFHTPVIDSDSTTKALYQPGNAVMNAIRNTFGVEYFLSNGELNKPKMAEHVFSDSEALNKLNAIAHPATIAEIKRKIAEYEANGHNIIFVESALASQAGYQEFCDELWLVYASIRTREARLSNSRNYSHERISQLFSSQDTQKEYLRTCNRIIVNEEGTSDSELLRQGKILIYSCSYK